MLENLSNLKKVFKSTKPFTLIMPKNRGSPGVKVMEAAFRIVLCGTWCTFFFFCRKIKLLKLRRKRWSGLVFSCQRGGGLAVGFDGHVGVVDETLQALGELRGQRGELREIHGLELRVHGVGTRVGQVGSEAVHGLREREEVERLHAFEDLVHDERVVDGGQHAVLHGADEVDFLHVAVVVGQFVVTEVVVDVGDADELDGREVGGLAHVVALHQDDCGEVDLALLGREDVACARGGDRQRAVYFLLLFINAGFGLRAG